MVIWVLILQVLWTGVFTLSTRYFRPADRSQMKIAALEKKLHKNAMVMARLEIAFSEYKDTVAAAGVRILNDTPWTDAQREVASVFADPSFKNVPHLEVRANHQFEKGKKYFIQGDYGRASEILQDFVNQSSENANLPQAAYLLGESYYYQNQLESSLKSIDLLITHFPETEFAGYALLRLGKIYDQQSRPEDAAEMYRLVMSEYAKSNAAALAKKNLKELPL